MNQRPRLTLADLKAQAKVFAQTLSSQWDTALFGVTDGKAIGTYVEQRFKSHLRLRFDFEEGSTARGIDFPVLGVDLKVTSRSQPQSSCPFESARQKVYGLGYALLVFVYEKREKPSTQEGNLVIERTLFIEKDRTGDFQTTTGLLRILENKGNKDDILAFFEERMLPLDSITASELADEVIKRPPEVGYLTISTALQWRLQYSRAIEKAGAVPGIERLT